MQVIEIIGAPQSIFVRTTRMAFQEKGVGYCLTAAGPHTPQVDALHPFGKIPVMRQGDFTLFESKAIATYVDLAFEGPALVPREPKRAALVEQWIFSSVGIRFTGRPCDFYRWTSGGGSLAKACYVARWHSAMAHALLGNVHQ